jgi:hypothetical protein
VNGALPATEEEHGTDATASFGDKANGGQGAASVRSSRIETILKLCEVVAFKTALMFPGQPQRDPNHVGKYSETPPTLI